MSGSVFKTHIFTALPPTTAKWESVTTTLETTTTSTTTSPPTTTTTTTAPTTTSTIPPTSGGVTESLETTVKPPCLKPSAKLDLGADADSATEYIRSGLIILDATVEVDCTPPQTAIGKWVIHDLERDLDIPQTPPEVEVSADNVEIDKNHLALGTYKVTLSVHPELLLEPEMTVEATGFLKVIASPLKPRIEGGSSGSASKDFVVDASKSSDPDDVDAAPDFDWGVELVSGDDVAICGGQYDVKGKASIRVTYREPAVETVCKYTVTVKKGERTAAASKTIKFVDPTAPIVNLRCAGENCPDSCVRIHLPVKLVATCQPGCDSFDWFVTKMIGGTPGDKVPDVKITRSAEHGIVTLERGQFLPKATYTIEVKRGEGFARLDFATCPLAVNGICSTDKSTGRAVADTFQVACSDWRDDDFPNLPDSPLSFAFTYRVRGDSDSVLVALLSGKGSSQTDRFLLPEGVSKHGHLVDIIVKITAKRGGLRSIQIPIEVLPNDNPDMDMLSNIIKEGSSGGKPLVVQRTCALTAQYSKQELSEDVADAFMQTKGGVRKPDVAKSFTKILRSVAAKSGAKAKDNILNGVESFAARSDSLLTKHGALSDAAEVVSGMVDTVGSCWVDGNPCAEKPPYPKVSADPAPAESRAAAQEYKESVAKWKAMCRAKARTALGASSALGGTLSKAVVTNEQTDLCAPGLCMSGGQADEDSVSKPLPVNGGSIKIPACAAKGGVKFKMLSTTKNTVGGDANSPMNGLTLTGADGKVRRAGCDGQPYVVTVPNPNTPTPTNVSCQGSWLVFGSSHHETIIVITDRACNIMAQVANVTFLSQPYSARGAFRDQFEGEVQRLFVPLAAFEKHIDSAGNITVNVTMTSAVDWKAIKGRPEDTLRAHTSVKCVFYNEDTGDWDTEGLNLLPATSLEEIVCASTHLTLFSSSWVVPPNSIDFSTVFDNLDQKFLENIHVVITVLGLLVVYAVLAIVLRRKDKEDLLKWGIAPLSDNLPGDLFDYHVTVHTASRSGAATKSGVFFMLAGEQGETEVRKLEAIRHKRLTRGSVHRYILSVPHQLGPLLYIRVWHDNSGRGAHASWFLDRIVVKDVTTSEKFVFLCNRWLAVDRDDGQVERLLPVATLDDLKTFQFLFQTTAQKDLSDGHLWFSLLSRPTYSRFTRVQRLSCCIALLYATMIANAMWYKTDDNVKGTQYVRIGSLEFTPQQVFISICSSVVSIPVSVLIVFLFRRSRPRPPQARRAGKPPAKPDRPSDTKMVPMETANADEISLKSSDSASEDGGCSSDSPEGGASRCSVRSQPGVTQLDPRDVAELNKQLEQEDKPSEESRSAHGGDATENHDAESPPSTKEGGAISKKPARKGVSLPWWCVYIAWVLVVLTVAVSGFFTILYSFEWGKVKSLGWLTSFLLSFFQSVLFIQPFKVIALAMVVALIFKRPPEDEDDFTSEDLRAMAIKEKGSVAAVLEPEAEAQAEVQAEVQEEVQAEVQAEVQEEVQAEVQAEIPRPAIEHRVPYTRKELDDDHLENMRHAREKELRMFAIFKEIIVYLIYLIVLSVLTYDTRNPHSYNTKRELFTLFNVNLYNKLGSKGALYDWMESTLVPNLYAERWYNDEEVSWRHRYFLSDLYYFRIGSPRLRLARVKKGRCGRLLTAPAPVPAGSASDSARPCFPEYNLATFDNRDYGPEWLPETTRNVSDDDAWKYRSSSELSGAPLVGRLTVYGGGGYVASLGGDPSEARAQLRGLRQQLWLDRASSAVFVEFNVLNPSTLLFTTLTFMAEFPPTGGVLTRAVIKTLQLYSYVGAKAIVVVVLQLVFVAFTVYHTVLVARRLKADGCALFGRCRWNIVDAVSIGTAYLLCAMYGVRFVMVSATMSKFHKNTEGFINFTYVVYYDELYSYVLGFLVFLAMLKLLRLLRFNQKIAELMFTLQATMRPLKNFLLFFAIMYMAFAQFGYLVLGPVLPEYATFMATLQSLFSIMLMNFSFEDLRRANHVLGPLFFFAFIVIMGFVVMNMFLSILNEVYSTMQQMKLTTSSDAEMVDYMLQQFKGLLGFLPDYHSDDKETDVGKDALNDKDKLKKLLNISQDNVVEKFHANSPMVKRKTSFMY